MSKIKGARGAAILIFYLLLLVSSATVYGWLYFGRQPGIYEAAAAGVFACTATAAVFAMFGVNRAKLRADIEAMEPRVAACWLLGGATALGGLCFGAAEVPQPATAAPTQVPSTRGPPSRSPSPGVTASGSTGEDVGCPIPPGHNVLAPASSPQPRPAARAGVGQAHIDGVASLDGKPGMGSSMAICVTVTQSPSPNRQLWLIVRRNPAPDLTHPLYFAKWNLGPQTGLQKIILNSRCGSATNLVNVNTTRTLMIVSASQHAVGQLQDNYDADQDCNTSYDNDRLTLPQDATVISNQGDVLRTR